MKWASSKIAGGFLVLLAVFLLVSLTGIKNDLDERDAFLCAAFHADSSLDPAQCPVHTSNTSWYLTAAFVFSFLVGIAGLFLLLLPGKNALVEKTAANGLEQPTEIDTSKLDDEERKIYTLIQQREGSMYQSDLIKEMGFSKVHMTRILDRMEGKRILERKRRGMTNIIVLR